MIGRSLSHFRITALLGEGGMGAVYRAEDTRLDREVAIKVLPDAFASDPERVARFEREAKLLASLNHPNVAAIYEFGSGEVDGDPPSEVYFLVIELVEGEDLAERLARGPIPVREALDVALQVARGLEAAHAGAVVHRDLKPGNIRINPAGQAKILDFGLAKTAAESAELEGDPSISPTLTAQMTRAGTILGTAAYMSPEQARGLEVDAQTDIWALGVVLYEMLTGERMFAGETATDTIAAIIERQPDWSALPAQTPRLVRSLLRRCLEKDRSRRVHDVADARLELEEALLEPSNGGGIAEAGPSAERSTRRPIVWLVAGGLAGLLIGGTLAGWLTRGRKEVHAARPAAHLSIDLAEGTTLDLEDNPAMAVSPDGRMVVWVARGSDAVARLWARRLDEPDPRPIEGSENAFGPFFSPDGTRVAYFDDGGSQLKAISVDGGLAKTICAVPPSSKGGAWSERGEIVFSSGYNGGLSRVSADGGDPQPLTETDRAAGIKSHRFPQFLPGGRAVVFMVAPQDIETFSDSSIEALDLDTGERKLLIEGGMSPRYAASGHLVFARQGRLFAMPFDADTLEIEGSPRLVLDGVVSKESYGFAQYAFGGNGLLLYAPGGPQTYAERVVRADRTGAVESLPLPERSYGSSIAFSPDGRTLAVTVADANFDVWLWDFERQVFSRLTRGWNNQNGIWSPDGRGLVFRSDRRASGTTDFYWVPADGSSDPRLIFQPRGYAWNWSWSPDGRNLLYYEISASKDFDVWALPLDQEVEPGEPRQILGTRANETFPVVSPDGVWLAYASDETGTSEVYVTSFSGTGPRRQVSSGGGMRPGWGGQGDEVFYIDPVRSRVMRATVESEPELTVGAPQFLFAFPSSSRAFSVDPDGKHFVFMERGQEARPITHLRLVLNWFDQLKGMLDN